LSEEARREFRKANLGIAAGILVLLIGFLFLHDNDAGMQGLTVGALIACLGIPFYLDWREERARREGSRRSP
jgi:hypothetical protein